ncbi:CHASE domain-containing protein [Actomonas aquatica]|uniref:histidine kinase n=1 Tax=Actomonas aquatica TaxID=2866162 RepID=A0ABZ1CA85_9BACT|nr:CHASE domain-containing protein [Opitutus sp. WL0086]WRQ88555.1 CHASE domain-containing protein [Opitutus sp. WL0086]
MPAAAPESTPSSTSRHRVGLTRGQAKALVWGVTLVGLALSVFLARRAQLSEEARIRDNFRTLATFQIAANRERVSLIEELLGSLRRGIMFQGTVTREEFDGMCADIINDHEGFLSLQWVQYVPHRYRSEVERALSLDYGQPLPVKQRTRDGGFAPAADQDVYHIIRHAYPLEFNAIVLGYDVSTAPSVADQNRALQSRSLAVTAPFRLAQATPADDTQGIIFILPVFEQEPFAAVPRGFVQGVFRMDGIFAPAIQPEYTSFATFRYFAVNESDGIQHLLYSSDAAEHAAGIASAPDPDAPFVVDEFAIGGRTWRFTASPSPTWLQNRQTREPETLFIAGFCISLLSALSLHSFFRRAHEVERLVEERTHALLTHQNELQAILDNSPNAIWIKDDTGHYILANKEMAELYGLTVEQIVGHRDEALFNSEIAEKLRESDRRVLESRVHSLFEGEYDIRGEKRYYYTVKFPLFDADGEPFGVGGISTDVTTFKRVETQLAETQKLESLGVLAGGIAHDFNNLLTGMLGNASLISLELPPETEVGHSAREIETAARRAAELCRQMLAYSGRGKFVVERLDLSSAIRELVPLLRSSVRADVTLKLDLADDLPPIDVDPSQLRQIIMNLVINASEATDGADGRVMVHTATADVDSETLRAGIGHPDLPAGRYVRFRVTDNGCGITPDNLRRIFEPFFTTKFTGRGLGLSAVLGIVRSHHGAMLVDSIEGKGTTFELLLPSAEGEFDTRPPLPVSPLTASGRLRGKRIFLVEDEPSIYQLATRVLARVGAHVTAYENGARAASEFHPGQHDFAVLDLTLPGLSGREILIRLRDRDPRLPVLLISGYSENEAIQLCGTNQPDGFLQKPFSADELVKAIETILGQRA